MAPTEFADCKNARLIFIATNTMRCDERPGRAGMKLFAVLYDGDCSAWRLIATLSPTWRPPAEESGEMAPGED